MASVMADAQLAVRLEVEPGSIADGIENIQQDRCALGEGDHSSDYRLDKSDFASHGSLLRSTYRSAA